MTLTQAGLFGLSLAAAGVGGYKIERARVDVLEQKVAALERARDEALRKTCPHGGALRLNAHDGDGQGSASLSLSWSGDDGE